MWNFRVLLWALATVVIISTVTAENRRQRPRRQPPPPLYLYPGPHPPPSRKRPNSPPRRPLRQSSPYQSDSMYNDPEPYRSSHSKPPSLYSQYEEFPPPYSGRPQKSKKPSYSNRGPPPSKKYPYYTSASSHKPHRPSMSNSPYANHQPAYSAESLQTIPKETIATFVNRPSGSYKGTPTLSYHGYNSKPSVSYGPPYPPKPFKAYGVPSTSHDYVEEEYDDDEEMYGSHHQLSATIKHSRPSLASSHYSFDSGNMAVKYANDAHQAGSFSYPGPTKFPETDVLVDPHPMRGTTSPPGPFKMRRKRPQREDESQQYSVSTSRPFKKSNLIQHPIPETPKYPAVDLNPTYTKPKYSSLDMTGAYKTQYPVFSSSEINGPTPNYPDHVHPTVEVISGNRPKFSIKEVFPNRESTKYSSSEVNTGADDHQNNYDHFLKETFNPNQRGQEYSDPDVPETTSVPTNHQTTRTRKPETSKHRERVRNASNRFKTRLRAQPTRQYEVHDEPEDREDVVKATDFEYTE